MDGLLDRRTDEGNQIAWRTYATETSLRKEQARQAYEMNMNTTSSSLMKDVELSGGTGNMNWEQEYSITNQEEYLLGLF